MVYDEFPKPSVTADIVIFTIIDRKLNVLLIKRGLEPSKGKWALPGGFVHIKESIYDAAKRELEEETGVKDVYLEQLYTFGNPNRDSRGRVITVAHYALINLEKQKQHLHADADSQDAKWFSINNLPQLAFDHRKILDYALKRLKWKFEYSTIGFSMLSSKFTMSELQEVYEIVFDREFDKRNFRKKVLSLEILKDEEIKKDVSHRPPQMYSLKKDVPEVVEIV
ncbi:NUDIX hydrolase [Candidatus Pacearchaeota archaeon]|nr:NUDIX hydrolase [Candidatus Pacearchaeota archaeon]